MGSQSEGDPFPPLSQHGLGIRYVTINKTDGSLEDHSIFLVTKSIEAYGSIEEAWNNRRDGSLTVALKEKYAKRIIENMKTLADNKTPVTVKLHATLNSSRAVVACKQLAKLTENEILAELQNQRVINAKHISRVNGGKDRINTGVVILTFSTPAAPERVKIG